MELIKALGISWPTLISQLINFGILYWLLKKYALTGLLEAMDRRQQAIATGLKNAQAADQALTQARAQQEEILTEARRQAQEIVSGARQTGQQQEQAIIEQAHRQAAKIVSDGQQQVQLSKEKMLLEVKGELADIIAIGVQKVAGQQVDPRRLQHEYLQAGLKA